MFVLIVSVLIGGVFQPDVARIRATSPQCVHEQLVLNGMNLAYRNAGIDRIVFGECRSE